MNIIPSRIEKLQKKGLCPSAPGRLTPKYFDQEERHLAFSELDITSNFTFLTGGSHPEEYVDRAALIGLDAVAITDENSVAGIVRAHTRAREIRRQVDERLASDLIGPPMPVAGWQRKPELAEHYPGATERRREGTLVPEEIEDYLDGPRAAFETRVTPPPMDASALILNMPRLIPVSYTHLRAHET